MVKVPKGKKYVVGKNLAKKLKVVKPTKPKKINPNSKKKRVK
jgi:hypothetical protein